MIILMIKINVMMMMMIMMIIQQKGFAKILFKLTST